MCQHCKGYTFTLFVTITLLKSRASACFHETRIHIRRHIGRFPVPGSAQSRVKRVSKIGPGCLGYYPVKSFQKSHFFFFPSTISPDNLVNCLTVLTLKNFSFRPVLTPILSTYCHCLLSSSHTCLVHLLGTSSQVMAYETHPKPSLLQTERDQRHSSH